MGKFVIPKSMPFRVFLKQQREPICQISRRIRFHCLERRNENTICPNVLLNGTKHSSLEIAFVFLLWLYTFNTNSCNAGGAVPVINLKTRVEFLYLMIFSQLSNLYLCRIILMKSSMFSVTYL